MTKVDILKLDSVTNNDTAATLNINTNFKNLQEAVENTLSRDGSTPNYMQADLDMNSKRIINASMPVDDRDLVTKKYVDDIVGNAQEFSETAKEYANSAKISATTAQSSAASSLNSLNAVKAAEVNINNIVEGFTLVAEEAIADVKAEGTVQSNKLAAEGTAIITTATAAADTSRKWAEGTDSEVQGLGGVHSSKVWSETAKTIVEDAITTIEGSIGDIGFAPLGIDESLNKRRYLNGQVISQAQFQSFTTKVKSAVALYPSLATTEANWQAEVTNSKLGQCGKFVIDDVLGTIRLPKVVNINGLQNLALMGGIKAESLPNITAGDSSNQNTLCSPANAATGTYGAANILGNADDASKFQIGGLAGILKRTVFDASRSSSTYKNGAPVQQEAIQYPYFIQVATGVEESVDVTREIELNNPFSLLDYKWSEYALSNASWLLSNGQFNSGATYVAVYELLLKIYNGTETKDGVSVKLSTEAYADTDFVINTANTTFRLPIKVKLASGKAVVGNGMAFGLSYGNTAGSYFGLASNLVSSSSGYLTARESYYGSNVGSSTDSGTLPTAGKSLGVTTDLTKSGIETSSSGLKLYFYVGETIQDANLINAGQMSTLISQLRECHVVIETYVNGTSGYRIWSDGYCEQWGNIPFTATGGWTAGTITFLKPFKDTNYYINGRGNWSDRQSSGFGLNSKTTTNFNVTVAINTLTSENGAWIACGYLAEGEY